MALQTGFTLLVHVLSIPKAESTNVTRSVELRIYLACGDQSLCSIIDLPSRFAKARAFHTGRLHRSPLAKETADMILTFYTFN